MKFITFLSLLILSLIISGTLVLFGIVELTGLHWSTWFLLSLIISTALFKYRFPNLRAYRYFLLKRFIEVNAFFKKIDQKVSSGDDDATTPLQEKAIRLWRLCLKDSNSIISCSISNGTRQIEKDNMLIILNPINAQDYLMTILDVDNDKSSVYEIRIGNKISELVIQSFDNENEKRMRAGEEERRKTIYNDLDKLLLQEEKALMMVSTKNTQ